MNERSAPSPEPCAGSIPARFLEVTSRAPESPALVDGPCTLTYRQLAERSAALAQRLRAAGAAAETPVGIMIGRSAEFVVAALAVLMAGAAYVPLAPEYPAERLRYLVRDCAAPLLLTTAGGPDAGDFGVRVVQVPRALDPAALDPAARDGGLAARPADPHPDSLAYIIYTSGSTGQPKGVGVTHGNLLGLVTGQDYVPFGPAQTFLQLAPVSFDASAFEMWGALLNGARLVIAAPSYHAISELPAVLRDHGVSTLLLTPALFHELVRTRIEALRPVRRLIVGGEAMSVPLARAYAHDADGRGATFANVYGPTETTTLVSCCEIPAVPRDAEAIPLGSPIRGAVLRLLDERLEPVGPGGTGEIFIAGSCVTRGYVGRPGPTARQFLPDPCGPPGTRMYASGDLGLMRDDGQIEFAGRRDDQLKVRGHRVEPREVEDVLLGHLPVRAAAVSLTGGDGDGGAARLAAYVVLDGDAAGGTAAVIDQLRAMIAAALPAYAAPSAYYVVEALPLTPSGKVDRRALPELAQAEPAQSGLARAGLARSGLARSGLAQLAGRQAVLAGIWRDVLAVPDVGLDDDFFAVGGDSLLAIRVVALAEERGMAISLVDLFSAPTIRGLCDAGGPGEVDAEPPAAMLPVTTSTVADLRILPAGIEAAFPATLMQQGVIFEASYHESGAIYHDVISRQIGAPFEEALFRSAVGLVAAAHPALRSSFSLGDYSVPVQLVASHAEIPVTVTDLGPAPPAGWLDAEIDQAGRPFDPSSCPLLRIRVAVLGRESFQLTYGFHHAIMDGWSDSVFFHDLISAYDRLLGREHATVPVTAASALEAYASLERQSLASAADQAFWQARCRDLAALAKPPDAARSAERIKAVLTVDAAVAARLDHVRTALRVPAKTLALAAHLAALGVMAGRAEAGTGLSVNGRPETAGGDRLVGLFLNAVPVRARLDGSWADLARRVLDSERALFPHRRYPYQAMAEGAAAPLFDVVFNYVHFHLDARRGGLARVTVGPAVIRDSTSRPLKVEFVQNLDGGQAATMELTADPAVWPRDELDAALAAHLDALTRCGDDPAAAAVPAIGAWRGQGDGR